MRMTLKLFRIRHKMSQAKMAETLGYSRNQYARIENGDQDVSLNFLEALAGTFNISLDEAKELTKRDDEREKNGRETC